MTIISKTELLARSRELQWKFRTDKQRFLAHEKGAEEDLAQDYDDLACLSKIAEDMGLNLREFCEKYNKFSELNVPCRRKTDKC